MAEETSEPRKQTATTDADPNAGKFYHTEESVDQYITLAEGYDGAELIAELRKHLPEGSLVLELGMGAGKDLDILLKTYKATGSDLSAVFVERYRKIQPNADLLVLDAVSLTTTRTFDAIYSNKVLHHLTDEGLVQSVQRQTQVLNDVGIVCHSFWNGEGDSAEGGLLHNYHTVNEIEEVFTNSFHILHLGTYKEMEPDDSILLIGRKK